MAPKAPPKKKSHVLDFLIIFAIICLLGGAGVAFAYGYGDYSQMRDMQLTWTEMVDLADSPDPERPDGYYVLGSGEMDLSQGYILDGIKPSRKMDENDYLYRSINLKALREINPDVSGYIYIPDTQVNYPILKEQEPEKYFYLYHDIHKEYDRYGSIFEISDEERNVRGMNNAVNILFGHNMRSGAMFAGIVNYRYSGFDKHPVYVYRDEYRIEYMPFATCVVDAHDGLYDFDAYAIGSSEYIALLDWIKEKNTVNFTTEFPDENTPIVAMSTCNDAYSDIRIVVFLRETRRALVPEYYESIKDVHQYGGDENGILQEKPEEEDHTWFDEYWATHGGRPDNSDSGNGNSGSINWGGNQGSGGSNSDNGGGIQSDQGGQGFIIGGRGG